MVTGSLGNRASGRLTDSSKCLRLPIQKRGKIRIYLIEGPEGYYCEFLWQDALSKELDSTRFTSLIDGGRNRDILGVERTARLSQGDELHGALLD